MRSRKEVCLRLIVVVVILSCYSDIINHKGNTIGVYLYYINQYLTFWGLLVVEVRLFEGLQLSFWGASSSSEDGEGELTAKGLEHAEEGVEREFWIAVFQFLD